MHSGKVVVGVVVISVVGAKTQKFKDVPLGEIRA